MKETPEPFDVCDFSKPLEKGTTLIEASAGTGKTYTVAALFIRLILEEALAIDQILVTTFTIPATAELTGRIRTLLRETLDALGGESSENSFVEAAVTRYAGEREAASERLRGALNAFDEAAIQTIHGFCRRVLEEGAFESGAQFGQEFVTDQSSFLREIASDYWRRSFYICEKCLAAAATVGKLTPQVLQGLLAFTMNHPLARIVPEGSEAGLADAKAGLMEVLTKLTASWKESSRAIRAFFPGDQKWGKAGYNDADRLATELDAIGACLCDGHFSGFSSLLRFSRPALELGTLKKGVTPVHLFFDLCEELQNLAARYAAEVQADFLRWAPAELRRRKVRQGVRSFSDLLTELHGGLLSNPEEMTAAVRGRYRAALIDEFQDTDGLQDEIFQRLFGDGNGWLFLIGDPKQAIYGFRGADVFTYLRAASRATRQFTLRTNFRSSHNLVKATNTLFCRNDAPFALNDIKFQPASASGENDAAAFTGDAITAPLRIWEWKGGQMNIAKVRAQIVESVAGEVARILGGESRLGDKPVVPRDIAILTSTNAEALDTQAALSTRGIPGVVMSNADVFDSEEAFDLLTVLAAIASPNDERRLRASLWTELMGVQAADIEALTADERAWEGWLLRAAEWLALWKGESFIHMFRRMLHELGVRRRFFARLQGERSVTNLLHLSELLQQAASDNSFSPAALVKWFAEKIAPREGDTPEEHQIRLDRDDDAVQIVTVHKSKGLEFEIVICPFLWECREENGRSVFRFHDPSNDLSLTLDLGSSQKVEHLALARAELLAEQTRLVYVAITRAKQRCDFIWGRFPSRTPAGAVAWLLHPPFETSDPAVALAKKIKSIDEAQVRADLENLCEQSDGTISIVEMPSLDGPSYLPAAAKKPALHVKTFTRRMEVDWAVSSFSSLSAQLESEAPDRDAPAIEPPMLEQAEPEGIHALPGGVRTGLCLHEIMEEMDFTDTTALSTIAARKLAAYSFDKEKWLEPVVDCVARTMSVKLRGGFSLSEIPKRDRLSEVEFYLPVDRIEAATLRSVLGSDEWERLDFAPRRGWLMGYIDLVFRRDGRYYIVDWKSNRLGSRSSSYTQAACDGAMASHFYGLQLHLYTVALHRYLRSRLPGYDYNKHFGGAYYIFMRGVDPAQPGLAIASRRPDGAVIAALDAFLGGTCETMKR